MTRKHNYWLSGMLLIFFVCATLLIACSPKTKPVGSTHEGKSQGVTIASPACIVYKTKKNYDQNVPVILSADKLNILSYPDIKDVYVNGTLALPTPLSKGYLLDNRGIGPDVAFLSYTYEEYGKLPATPSSTELLKKIIDKDPVLEMYQCGKRSDYSDIVNQLNEKIESGKLSLCKKLK
jgi:hypothetical protein